MKRNLLILAAVAVCMALLVASAVLSYRHRQAELAARPQKIELVPASTQANATGAGLMPDGSQDFRGRKAPDFTLKTLDGKPVSLKDLRGKAVLINFWATWCAPCKIEIPWFIALSRQYDSQGLVVLGIDADPEDVPVAEIRKSVKTLGITYPVLLRGDTIGDQWGGLDGLPTSFYLSRDGTIVDQTVGLYSRDEVEAKIKKILGPSASGPVPQLAQGAANSPTAGKPEATTTGAAKP